jgi:hypothetical protein
MVSAFDRLPPKVSAMFGRYLNFLRPRLSHLAVPVHQAGLLAEHFPKVEQPLRETCGAELVHHLHEELLPADPQHSIRQIYEMELRTREGFASVAGKKTRERLEALARDCVLVLQHYWNRLPVQEAFGQEPAEETAKKVDTADGLYPLHDRAKSEASAFASEVPRSFNIYINTGSPTEEGIAPDEDLLLWLRQAEDFVATQVVGFLLQFFVHLRNLVEFLVVASLLLVLTVLSYSFQPQRLLLVLVTTILALVAGVILVFLVQMDRDELTSRISRTIPNRLTFDRAFVSTLFTYVVPLIGILILQFADVRDVLAAWLDPVLRVLK